MLKLNQSQWKNRANWLSWLFYTNRGWVLNKSRLSFFILGEKNKNLQEICRMSWCPKDPKTWGWVAPFSACLRTNLPIWPGVAPQQSFMRSRAGHHRDWHVMAKYCTLKIMIQDNKLSYLHYSATMAFLPETRCRRHNSFFLRHYQRACTLKHKPNFQAFFFFQKNLHATVSSGNLENPQGNRQLKG